MKTKNWYKNDDGTVLLLLDRERELRMTHRALCRVSALIGCAMTELEDAMSRYDKLSAMLYVMLSEDDNALTPEAVDELIAKAEREQRLKILDLINAVGAALEAAFTDEADDDEPQEDEHPLPGAGETV